jgi:hypothetical protein
MKGGQAVSSIRDLTAEVTPWHPDLADLFSSGRCGQPPITGSMRLRGTSELNLSDNERSHDYPISDLRIPRRIWQSWKGQVIPLIWASRDSVSLVLGYEAHELLIF